jgi:hypothetical protein
MENNEELPEESKNEITQAADHEKIINEITIWLATNESVKTYLENFNQYSAGNFKREYPLHKKLWMDSGEFYFQNNMNNDAQWINEAWESLEMIQQKKLFDAQCLWRAEQVQFKEVEIAYDFTYWGKNVLNCPFIDLINEDDIAMLAHFLEGINPEKELGFIEDWQDYDEIKAAYHNEEENRNFPEWYEFCNTYRGTTTYMLLPDIRGQKEQHYADAARVKSRQDYAEANPNPIPPDTRPMISIYDHEQIIEFIKMFESKDLLRDYNNYTRATAKDDIYPFDVDNLLFRLAAIEEQVPIEAHADYKMALYYALEKYANKKTAEYLTIALEQYIMNHNLGLEQPITGTDYSEIRTMVYQLIIDGRILKGEAPNLDF